MPVLDLTLLDSIRQGALQGYGHVQHDFFVGRQVDGLAAGSTDDLQVTTGAGGMTVQLQLVHAAQASAGLGLLVYEAPTTSDGTAVTPVDLDRERAAAAGSAWVHTPTVTGVGTKIYDTRPGIGHPSSAIVSHIHLKPSTKYLFRVINDGSVAADLALSVFFTE